MILTVLNVSLSITSFTVVVFFCYCVWDIWYRREERNYWPLCLEDQWGEKNTGACGEAFSWLWAANCSHLTTSSNALIDLKVFLAEDKNCANVYKTHTHRSHQAHITFSRCFRAKQHTFPLLSGSRLEFSISRMCTDMWTELSTGALAAFHSSLCAAVRTALSGCRLWIHTYKVIKNVWGRKNPLALITLYMIYQPATGI